MMQADPVLDEDLARRAASNDVAAFEMLMRRHNTRLFRTARAILRDDSDAEDAVQDAYVEAYRHLSDFRGEARFGTWLVRIVVNQALMRLRRQKRDRTVLTFPQGDAADVAEEVEDTTSISPAAGVLRDELRRLLESHIDSLPVAFRTVFILREVEEMNVDETASALNIPAATVRTRLFRARALLRASLAKEVDVATGGVFGFAGARCDRIVERVLARLPSIDA